MACDCVRRLNEHYAPHHVEIKTTVHYGPEILTTELDQCEPIVRIAIGFDRMRRGATKPNLVPNFCPICGVRYVPESTEASS